jgi:hypothetical protein
MVEALDSRDDSNCDNIRLLYPFSGRANSEVRVCRASIVQGETWVKARVEGYFKYNNKPEAGTVVEIPDYQFNPSLFQPEWWK